MINPIRKTLHSGDRIIIETVDDKVFMRVVVVNQTEDRLGAFLEEDFLLAENSRLGASVEFIVA